MTASYPNSGRAFRNPTSSTTAVQSDGTDLHAADHTAVEEEVAAISSDLRTAKGASANIATKIAAMDSSISGLTTAGGDLSGTMPNPTVVKIQGRSVTSTAPTAGQALAWNGTAWAPATISGGGGGTVTAVTGTAPIVSSGGTTPAISISDATTGAKGAIQLAGDLAGTASAPTVAKIQNRTVASTAPTSGQAIAWNSTSSQWEPTTISGSATLQNTRPYVLVAASDAPATLKSAADYVCAGSNDEDTIMTAIGYAGANGIFNVKLTAGTFYIDDLNVLNLAYGVGGVFYVKMMLQGTSNSRGYNNSAGDGGTRLKYNKAAVPAVSGPMLKIQPFASDPGTGRTRTNYTITNISIDGKGFANVTGLQVQWVNIFYLADLQISSCRGYGMYFNGASDGTVERFRIDDCGSSSNADGDSAIAGLMVSDNEGSWTADNIVFRDGWFENGMLRHLTVSGKDPAITYTSQQRPYRIVFDRCKFEANRTSGGNSVNAGAVIALDAVSGVTMTNCYFYAGSPASIASGTEDAIYQPGAFIRLRSSYNVNISNNLFSFSPSSGQTSNRLPSLRCIVVDASTVVTGLGNVADGITIENNQFEGSLNYGAAYIYFLGSSTNVVSKSNWRASATTTVESYSASRPTGRSVDRQPLLVADATAAPSVNTDNVALYGITAQTNAVTTAFTATGTPSEGDMLHIHLKSSSGTPALSWDAAKFVASTVTLPTTFTTTRVDLDFIWDSTASRWRLISKA